MTDWRDSIRTGDEFRDYLRRNGGFVSDGPVPADFTSGWTSHPFRGRLAHYWTMAEPLPGQPHARAVSSACGLKTIVTRQVPLLGPGNYAHCERCDAALLRQGRTRIAREYPEWIKGA
jgi:hypothetical protein